VRQYLMSTARSFVMPLFSVKISQGSQLKMAGLKFLCRKAASLVLKL